MMTSYYCQHDIQRKVTGHKQGPHRSPSAADESGSGGGSTTSIKWEEPRDCTWPLVSRFRYQWGRMHLFLQLLWGAQGLDTAELCQPWDKETMAADKMALFQPRPLGFLAVNDRALEESQNRVFFNFSFHSDQLMENRLRCQPRISSDLQVKEAGKCCPATGPRDRLGHWCRQGSGCHLPGHRDTARTLQ